MCCLLQPANRRGPVGKCGLLREQCRRLCHGRRCPRLPRSVSFGSRTGIQLLNFGVQRELTKDITVTASYAGSQSHFIAGAATMRGLQSGGINPKYFALGAGTYGAGFALKGGYCGKHRVGAGHYAWMLHFAVSRIVSRQQAPRLVQRQQPLLRV